MKIKVGVMGSSSEAAGAAGDLLRDKAESLARAIAAREAILLTGATTGVVYTVGQQAHAAGAFHLGISPAGNEQEHIDTYHLPTDACDALI